MKKYVSIALCAVLFLSAVFLNYESRLGGRGNGSNESVENIEELSCVIEDITRILDLEAIFARSDTETEKHKLLSSSDDEEDSYRVEHESVTIYNEYIGETVVTVGSDSIKTVISAEEEWYVSKGGERLFIKCTGEMKESDTISGVPHNTAMYLEFSFYYEAEKGFFIKYDDLKISGFAGGVIPSKILNKWISVESCDVIGIDMDKIFEQTLVKNYTWLQDFGMYLNWHLDDAFSKSGDTYIMENDVYEKFCTDSYNKSPDFSDMDLILSELEDLDGELKVNLADADSPTIYYTIDNMSFDAVLDSQLVQCQASVDQTLVITNINNTVVRELKLSSIYGLEDLLM